MLDNTFIITTTKMQCCEWCLEFSYYYIAMILLTYFAQTLIIYAKPFIYRPHHSINWHKNVHTCLMIDVKSHFSLIRIYIIQNQLI